MLKTDAVQIKSVILSNDPNASGWIITPENDSLFFKYYETNKEDAKVQLQLIKVND